MKKTKLNFINGTYATINSAWLLTWECDGEHAESKNRFVAIISKRYSESIIKKIIEQYYTSDYLSFREQFSCTKSKTNCPYKVENIPIRISERSQKVFSLPSQNQFAGSIKIGGNPYLWGRVVYELETWVDENGAEYLKWKERENISFDGGIKSDLKENSLKRSF